MKFGVEVTGVPPTPFDDEWAVPKLRRVVKNILAPKYPKVHIDQHCLEIPSPVFTSIGAFERWYKPLRRLLDAMGIFAHHEDVVCGGGHIHVELPLDRRRSYIKDLAMRPYLPWVFGMPDEEEAMDNFYDTSSFEFTSTWNKAKMVRVCRNTLEFRFFESARDWSEQKDHLDFVQAYLAYMRRKPLIKGIPPVASLDALQTIPQATAIDSFKTMCEHIGLPFTRYEKYVERNLLPRWSQGYIRR
jgi:hypothetical protein